MKVLLTANSAWNVKNFRLPIVNSLLGDGHRVTVLAPHDETARDLEAMGCKFVPLEMDVGGLSPAKDFRLYMRMHRHFATESPDAILSYTIKNNLYGAYAARKLGLPFVPNVTGLGTAFLSGTLLQSVAVALYRTAFRKLEVVFFQNSDDLELFLELGILSSDQAKLLPGSGIDLLRFTPSQLPSEERPTVFLMIARLLRDKGIMEYVKAAQIIRKDFPDVRFQILGALDANNRSAISASTVTEWEDGGAVEYLGSETDVRPAIAYATCVVLPSYREGSPRTLIEAAAMARPLIATDVPGCRSVVSDLKNGFLCKARCERSLADACVRFIELPHDKKVALGKSGRHKMEREFDQEIVVRNYRAVLNRLTGGKLR